MATFEDALNATLAPQQNGAPVVVHKTIIYYSHEDSPGVLQVGVGLATTWSPRPVIFSVATASDLPKTQQVIITEAQAEELIRSGAQDERQSDESREIERIVAARGRA